MNDRDGLYISNVLVAPANGIATTHQGNDLSKPASLQVSYSNRITVADSLLMRDLTANAEQLDSGSPAPYQALPAELIVGGETIFSGMVRLTSFQSGWNLTLFEQTKDLYTRLDRSIRTVDLSAYDRKWSKETINDLADTTTGMLYPLVDYGLLTNGEMPLALLFPAFYIHTLVTQFLYEEGYTHVGDLPEDALFKAGILPFVEADPTSQDEDFADKRYARVTLNSPEQHVYRTALDSGSFINRVQPYTVDDLPLQGFRQGTLKNFKVAKHSYVCDTAMRVRVQATQFLKLINVSGSIEAILSVEKNGINVGEDAISTPSGYNLLGAVTDELSLDELIDCQKGDQLRIHLIVRRKTKIGNFSARVYNDPDRSFATFTPSLTTAPGDTWSAARNLPDVKAKDILIALAYAFCGFWSINPRRRELRFISLNKTIQNAPNAVDWSDRVDMSDPPSWTPVLEPYAQTNYLRWNEDDETKIQGSPNMGYGDGKILVNAGTLEAETTLFDMPFAASVQSPNRIPGYGNPVLIKTRTISGSGANTTVNQQKASARILVVKPGAFVPVRALETQQDGITTKAVTVNLQTCWFALRPESVGGSDCPYSLAFTNVKGNRGEVDLITANYGGLQRVLRRMRLFDVSMRLLPSDIAELDFGVPVRLKRLQLGSLILNDQYFYLNKIANYQANKPCRVTLIAF